MKTKSILLALVVAAAISGAECMAQKGMGDKSGVSRWTVKPELTEVSGEVISINTHACELTTGRSDLGTHLDVRLEDGTAINLHLGPEDDVADMVSKLSVGDTIKADVFRTGKMKDNHRVAAVLYVNGESFKLRDEVTLKPVWSGR